MNYELTDENYKSILDNHFEKSQTVFCSITTNIRCSNCLAYKRNIENFIKTNPLQNVFFYYVEYAKYNILQNYYQLTNFIEYPKTIVFYGDWNIKIFVEGPISVEELEEICGIIREK